MTSSVRTLTAALWTFRMSRPGAEARHELRWQED